LFGSCVIGIKTFTGIPQTLLYRCARPFFQDYAAVEDNADLTVTSLNSFNAKYLPITDPEIKLAVNRVTAGQVLRLSSIYEPGADDTE
jgi:hypothetical protein